MSLLNRSLLDSIGRIPSTNKGREALEKRCSRTQKSAIMGLEKCREVRSEGLRGLVCVLLSLHQLDQYSSCQFSKFNLRLKIVNFLRGMSFLRFIPNPSRLHLSRLSQQATTIQRVAVDGFSSLNLCFNEFQRIGTFKDYKSRLHPSAFACTAARVSEGSGKSIR